VARIRMVRILVEQMEAGRFMQPQPTFALQADQLPTHESIVSRAGAGRGANSPLPRSSRGLDRQEAEWSTRRK
jgi:hypothetical protein